MNINQIANGPWLLAPTTNQITLAWETDAPMELILSYQTADGEAFSVIPIMEREPACPDNDEGYCLYTAVLSDLLSGVTYEYRILDGDQELLKASFSTLQETPEKICCVTVSDSHLFFTHDAFSNMVKRYHPDLLLHGGDISFGTGYQHEQYVNNWFSRIKDVLRWLPAYYIAGNHDDGVFYDWLFAKPQAKSVNSPDGGFTYSFDYGPAHIVMVNSNPWGLFEMNAANSGYTVDDLMREKIRQNLKWIENDLQSEKSQNASWRIVITHHPYTDSFNNRYIVPLIERCGVDLLIGGHLHYYIKSVSVDPAIGSRTVHVCQGSTQDPAAELDYGVDDKRLLGDFPEVIAMGNNNYGILEVSQEELVYKLYGFQEKEEDKLVDTVRITHELAHIELLNPTMRCLDTTGMMEITVMACNTGNSHAAVVLPVEDNGIKNNLNLFGPPEESRVIVLKPREKRQLTAYYRIRGAGKHCIRIMESEQVVNICDMPNITYNHMHASLGDYDEADCLRANVEAVNNTHDYITAEIPLYIDGIIQEIRHIAFRPNERVCVEFSYRFERSGKYLVSIGSCSPKTVYVNGGIHAVPLVCDSSGHGHDAFLRGNPNVIKEKGKTYVELVHPGDYIEIPASNELVAEDGFTGMVCARVDRLADSDEMSHNPLMVRGKSVGWGATYFMRMVIERNGGLKWGTCHDITEYSWQGGTVALGEWAQYTLSFDRKNGGISYINQNAVAHISGIESNASLRQWSTEPIFVGYSYIGHVIPELGRPKYYTHLPAAVGQVRFYKSALTSIENKQVLQNPEIKGPKSENLLVWLDFNNIKTKGCHITEWRHPGVYSREYMGEKKLWSFRKLTAVAHVPVGASVIAVVEVSDDQTSVRGCLEVQLTDGDNIIDLSDLPRAQFLRITTKFDSCIGKMGIATADVEAYEVEAANKIDVATMIWSTKPSWLKGKMSGAVGFKEDDRLRDFPEYTDIIHG
ncbi:MAG: metallophosphoesterase [Anaerovibrio sp.]|uniref:metallophosphoesterase family protein n=1 Tax=Anaerovibrio sp. TaxID=1872532 RepID=UPI0025D10F61|nr:metallophosphoesterase [Anaerovibrio sp.]MCR5175374.1 metallophosphoesterase [Anaerovibrio sp.]